ncbi:PTS lactose/cellobiose transporter subunit IIA [Collinsella sp. An2]|uniref:PTS lactose/cellobiose transporter subunit IIA n=1 Tax=Collinsella sp. An2 TaxID=1965585 RepID=UPI000B373E94|nr:PTS lactose/cellobiose transporter subunit IIA [Collinsella sp. An2]OUP09730.1 PTS lactose/cellobiose transporter subunit IIA [Collinsella sp. An2]
MASDKTVDTERFETQCFQIVAQVGSARSCYIEAISQAEKGDFEAARKLVQEGDTDFNTGHAVHMELLQQEADGIEMPFRIILLHAEDQLMSAEAFRILAERFINVYRHMYEQ